MLAPTPVATADARPRVRLQADEAEAHAARLQVLQKKAGRCLWLELEAAD